MKKNAVIVRAAYHSAGVNRILKFAPAFLAKYAPRDFSSAHVLKRYARSKIVALQKIRAKRSPAQKVMKKSHRRQKPVSRQSVTQRLAVLFMTDAPLGFQKGVELTLFL